MNYDEKTVSSAEIYRGGIIDVDRLTVELPNGKHASRDIVKHPGASMVIPISENGELYMVTQFRKSFDKTLLELPAGKLDHGEDPAVCAERELEEETGLTAESIKHVISIYTTPGFSNEIIHLYAATGLKEGDARPDEDEFISSEKYGIDELVKKIMSHEITDAKSVIGILLADKIIKGEIKI